MTAVAKNVPVSLVKIFKPSSEPSKIAFLIFGDSIKYNKTKLIAQDSHIKRASGIITCSKKSINGFKEKISVLINTAFLLDEIFFAMKKNSIVEIIPRIF